LLGSTDSLQMDGSTLLHIQLLSRFLFDITKCFFSKHIQRLKLGVVETFASSDVDTIKTDTMVI